MKYKMHDELDYALESVYLLELLLSENMPAQRVEEMIARHPAKAEEIAAEYAPVLALLERLERDLSTVDETARYLFEKTEGFDSPMALVFYLMQTQPECGGSIRKAFEKYLETDMTAALSFADDAAFSAYVMQSDMAIDVKAKVMMLYTQHDRFAEAYQDISDRTQTLLRKHEHLIAEKVQACVQVLGQWLEEDGLGGTLANLDIPIVLVESDEVYDIYPHVALSDGVRLADTKICWGVNFISLLTIRRQDGLTNEKTAEMLRVMGDKTKFEILSLLRTEMCYGSELAERLGLSAATISHHVSQLTSLRMVNIVKQGNRIYYEVNREQIAFILDAAKGMLA